MSEDSIAGGGGSTLDDVNVQDVIRDRKEERRLKAEEKRRGDLQRIKDMRSITGIDPLQRFPKEIWMKIFDGLNPEDRWNVWQVHPLFRGLMEGNHVQNILLPQILRLGKFQSSLWLDTRRHYFNEQLRCISKSTRKYFDRWIEEMLLRRLQEKEAYSLSYDGNTVNLGFNETDQREQLKRLLASFKEGEEDTAKRFFPRGLSVSISEFEDCDIDIADMPDAMNQFVKDITILLRRIGDQIWHFRFFLEIQETLNFSFSETYILFQGWISLMPNLEWLEVLILPPFQMIEDEEGAQSVLQNYPFPRLPHLERLGLLSRYRHRKRGCHNIYGVILGANQHIKMLDLNYGDDEDSNLDLPHPPPNLVESLELTRFAVLDEYSWSSGYGKLCWAEIQPIMNVNWKLETIILSLSSSETTNSIISVLETLQKFPTLRKVKLRRLENFIVRETNSLGYLELPNLTEFELELTNPEIDFDSNIHFFFSLQFLLRCSKLRKVSWTLNGFNDCKLRKHLKIFENQNIGTVMDFRAGLKYLYESNLWYIFPELDVVTVEFQKNRSVNIGSCSHEYLRTDIEGMTIKRFLKMHLCIRTGFLLRCVM